MGIGSNKEGLSAFGVLNKCVTSMGRRLLRLWFMRPIIDLHALNDRQDAIQVQLQCLPVALKMHEVQQHMSNAQRSPSHACTSSIG